MVDAAELDSGVDAVRKSLPRRVARHARAAADSIYFIIRDAERAQERLMCMGILSLEFGVPAIHIRIVESCAPKQPDPGLFAAPERPLSKRWLSEQGSDRLLPTLDTQDFLV
jgi:hypothetical protein